MEVMAEIGGPIQQPEPILWESHQFHQNYVVMEPLAIIDLVVGVDMADEEET